MLVFSPHPDDDVISMGGTLIRLVEDGHDVHIAYMTSGNIAVFDHDAARIAHLVTEYNRLFGIDTERSQLLERAPRISLALNRICGAENANARAARGHTKSSLKRCAYKGPVWAGYMLSASSETAPIPRISTTKATGS